MVELITQFGVVGGSFVFLLTYFMKNHKEIVKENKELIKDNKEINQKYIETLTEIKNELINSRKDTEELKHEIKIIKKTLGV